MLTVPGASGPSDSDIRMNSNTNFAVGRQSNYQSIGAHSLASSRTDTKWETVREDIFNQVPGNAKPLERSVLRFKLYSVRWKPSIDDSTVVVGKPFGRIDRISKKANESKSQEVVTRMSSQRVRPLHSNMVVSKIQPAQLLEIPRIAQRLHIAVAKTAIRNGQRPEGFKERGPKELLGIVA
jgi:hypothetical protein